MLWRQVRYGAQSIRRAPMHATVATATIALTVGLTAMSLSTVNGVRGPSLSERDGRLMAVELTTAQGAAGSVDFEALDLRDFRSSQTSFENLEGYFQRRVVVADDDGGSQSVKAGVVTAGALALLDAAPVLGRTFRQGEDFRSSIQHVVLGHDLWQQRYGGRPNIVGQVIRIDGRPLQVLGIMPPGFRFPVDEALWIPMDFDLPVSDRGSGRSFHAFGRLRSGVAIDAARAEARLIAERIAAENPGFHPPLSARVFPLSQRHVPQGLTSMLLVMLTAAAGLLLIGCTNVANLLLARALARRQDAATRFALGASRGFLVRQFLVEAFLLSMLGSIVGLAFATLGCQAFERFLISSISLPYWARMELQIPAALATMVVTTAVAVAASVLPALHATRRQASLFGRGGVGIANRLGRASACLVTTQIATSCALLIASGLLAKSLVQLRTLDPGFSAEAVVTGRFHLPVSDFPSGERRGRFFAQLLERAEALPGVASASFARSAPGTGPTFGWDFEVEGAQEDVQRVADGVPVAHHYFDVMGISLLAGRDFTEAETRFGTEPVVIVNDYLASRHLGEEPLGRRIRLAPEEPWLTVVGVVSNTYIGSSNGGIGMRSGPREQMYISWGVAPYSSATLLLRATTGTPTTLIPQAHALMQALAPQAPLFGVRGLREEIVDSTWAFAFFASLFTAFGFVALVISAIGLYGVMAFTVRQRRKELGIRIALGALPNRVLRLVVGTAAWQVGAGLGLGLGLGFLLARALRAMLFGVGAADPWVYVAIVLTLATTAMLAAIIPGRDALRDRPVEMLDA